jgi:hypothetical protein
MILTLREVLATCNDWAFFCRHHGFSTWCVNEGGGDGQVSLTLDQAYHLGIIKRRGWSETSRDEVYPPK